MTMARALLLMSLVTILCICATNAAMDASPGPDAMAMSSQVSGSPSQEPQEPPCCEDDKQPTPKTDDEECCEQEPVQELKGFKMYPNPAYGNEVYISTETNGTKEIRIYDVFGEVVLTERISTNTLDISRLVPGVYVLQVTEQKKTMTRKLVVK